MKKIISLISLSFIATSQLFAGVIPLSSLTKKEIIVISEGVDGITIKYDEAVQEFILDDSLEKELRLNGILKTEAAVKSTVCTGGGH
jgi:hypothetical protein